MELDDADRKILRAVQDRPQLTTRELAEEVGLSHTPCWRRLQRMEEEGVVSAPLRLVDPEGAGFDITAFCFVALKEHRREALREFEAAVEREPRILQCHSLSGEHDYMLHVLARSVRDYERTVKDALTALPHVRAINTSFALRRVKASAKVPV